jgi:hypothetical protein
VAQGRRGGGPGGGVSGERKRIEAGRLAFREEGALWNVYWARSQTTMAGAVLVASLALSVARLPGMREAFLAFSKTAFDALALDVTGSTATWTEPRSAPEHERTKE